MHVIVDNDYYYQGFFHGRQQGICPTFPQLPSKDAHSLREKQ